MLFSSQLNSRKQKIVIHQLVSGMLLMSWLIMSLALMPLSLLASANHSDKAALQSEKEVLSASEGKGNFFPLSTLVAEESEEDVEEDETLSDTSLNISYSTGNLPKVLAELRTSAPIHLRQYVVSLVPAYIQHHSWKIHLS